MNKKIGFLIGGVGLAIGGYAYYLKKQAEKLMSLEYRFQNIKFDNIGLSNIKIRADIVITNPSDVKFTINGYNIDILFRGKKIANVQKSNISTTLIPNGVATLPIEVQLDPISVTENLLSVLLSSIALGEEQPKGIRYVGKISGRFGLIGFKNIDVDYTYQ
jgi:LEA14-like dessication related protein